MRLVGERRVALEATAISRLDLATVTVNSGDSSALKALEQFGYMSKSA
jgi:hypothetical protein